MEWSNKPPSAKDANTMLITPKTTKIRGRKKKKRKIRKNQTVKNTRQT